MSVVLVLFPGAPKVSPEAQQKDAQLDQLIESKITGNTCVILSASHMLTNASSIVTEILSKNSEIVLNALIQNLLSEEMDWPPGAGIEAK